MRLTRVCLLFFVVSVVFGAAAASSGCGADVDDRPATFDYIYAAIVVPNCATAGCHSALTQTMGLNFSDKASAFSFWKEGENALTISDRIRGNLTALRMPPDQPLPMKDILLIEKYLSTTGGGGEDE
jgi:hypothetical protein